jgi:hypothetical protein
LLNRYTAQKLYPGFESLPHRQTSLALRASFVSAGERSVNEVCLAEAAQPRRRTFPTDRRFSRIPARLRLAGNGNESLPHRQTSLALRASFVSAGERSVNEVCLAEAAQPQRRTFPLTADSVTSRLAGNGNESLPHRELRFW